MNDLLPIDQVAGLLNLVQQTPNVVVPLIENVISGLIFQEYYKALHSINLSENTPIHDHIGKLQLCSLDTHSYQLTKSVQSDSRVVLLNHSDIMLN